MDDREAKIIETVIRVLEIELGFLRRNVRVPEDEPGISPNMKIDGAIKLGEIKFAIEHTVVEPYESFILESQNSRALEQEIWREFKGTYPNVGVDLLLPNDWHFRLGSQKKRKKFVSALCQAVSEEAPNLSKLEYNDRVQHFGTFFEIDVLVSRNGFELDLEGEKRPVVVLLAGDHESGRICRIRRSMDAKLGKLKRWRYTHQIVLILENRDISLTSYQAVRECVVKIFNDYRYLPVDYLYYVSASHPTWRVYRVIEKGSWSVSKPNGLPIVDRFDEGDLTGFHLTG